MCVSLNFNSDLSVSFVKCEKWAYCEYVIMFIISSQYACTLGICPKYILVHIIVLDMANFIYDMWVYNYKNYLDLHSSFRKWNLLEKVWDVNLVWSE